MRPGRRGDAGGNRDALAFALHMGTGGRVRVATGGRFDLLHFVGDGWRAGVVPMRYDRDEDAPALLRFPLPDVAPDPLQATAP